MTVRESSAADTGRPGASRLELFTDEQRMRQWISVDDATLCDLEEWR
jgi:hypothetical protein